MNGKMGNSQALGYFADEQFNKRYLAAIESNSD